MAAPTTAAYVKKTLANPELRGRDHLAPNFSVSSTKTKNCGRSAFRKGSLADQPLKFTIIGGLTMAAGSHHRSWLYDAIWGECCDHTLDTARIVSPHVAPQNILDAKAIVCADLGCHCRCLGGRRDRPRRHCSHRARNSNPLEKIAARDVTAGALFIVGFVGHRCLLDRICQLLTSLIRVGSS